MLFDQFNKVRKVFFTVKNFPFPVLNIFLEIISRGFGDAEILHGIGHLDTHFFTYSEKMINRVAGCKNNRGVVGDVDPVFPEFFGRYTFNSYELMEYNIDIELLCQISIW